MTNTKYIAYLDLLGTQNLSETNPNAYSQSVLIFSDLLKSSLKQNCRAYAFSDCAYLESDNLKSLLKTLDTLRDKMLAAERFFTAAVAQGELMVQATEDEENGFHGFLFQGASISKAYLGQTALKGIGISIDNNLLSAHNQKKCSSGQSISLDNCNIIRNFYISDISTPYKLHFFYDIAMETPFSEEILAKYFDYILHAYFLSNIKSPRYGRYYISPLINILSSIKLDDNALVVTTENGSAKLLVNPYPLQRLFGEKGNVTYLCKYAPGFLNIYLFLLDKIYQDRRKRDTVTAHFLRRILNLNLINDVLSDFSQIPKQLLSESSLRLLLQDYYQVIAEESEII